MQESAVVKRAAEMVKVLAHHPASMIEDRPPSFVNALGDGSFERSTYVDGLRDDGRRRRVS